MLGCFLCHISSLISMVKAKMLWYTVEDDTSPLFFGSWVATVRSAHLFLYFLVFHMQELQAHVKRFNGHYNCKKIQDLETNNINILKQRISRYSNEFVDVFKFLSTLKGPKISKFLCIFLQRKPSSNITNDSTKPVRACQFFFGHCHEWMWPLPQQENTGIFVAMWHWYVSPDFTKGACVGA